MPYLHMRMCDIYLKIKNMKRKEEELRDASQK